MKGRFLGRLILVVSFTEVIRQSIKREPIVNIHPEYIVDENLNKKSVVIPYDEWKEVIEEMEELDDIRAYDRAKKEIEDEVLPFEQAIEEIREGKLK
jgi:formate-dependent nitrite reductase cytochrome c552 subunit